MNIIRHIILNVKTRAETRYEEIINLNDSLKLRIIYNGDGRTICFSVVSADWHDFLCYMFVQGVFRKKNNNIQVTDHIYTLKFDHQTSNHEFHLYGEFGFGVDVLKDLKIDIYVASPNSSQSERQLIGKLTAVDTQMRFYYKGCKIHEFFLFMYENRNTRFPESLIDLMGTFVRKNINKIERVVGGLRFSLDWDILRFSLMIRSGIEILFTHYADAKCKQDICCDQPEKTMFEVIAETKIPKYLDKLDVLLKGEWRDQWILHHNTVSGRKSITIPNDLSVTHSWWIIPQ